MEILREIAFRVYGLIPKGNFAVIWAWPDNEDTVAGLVAQLSRTKIRKIIVLRTERGKAPEEKSGAKTKEVRKSSPEGLLWFACSKYVFFTHRCFMKRFPENVCSVNVWHGMPLKKIGRLLEGDEGIASRYLLATSPFWGGILRKAMDPTTRVLVTGLPRNDRLFESREEVFAKLHFGRGLKLVTWLPTYRKSTRGLSRSDGLSAGNPFEMAGVDPAMLNTYLETQGAVMLVKPHPMSESGTVESRSNLFIVGDEWLQDRGLSLYSVLAATDVLISDISSVFIDYLLLDRPIIHAFPDFSEYRNNRGFTVEPIEEYLAGPVVGDFEGLKVELTNALGGGDRMREERGRLRRLSHTHLDGNASERLIQEIMAG